MKYQLCNKFTVTIDGETVSQGYFSVLLKIKNASTELNFLYHYLSKQNDNTQRTYVPALKYNDQQKR